MNFRERSLANKVFTSYQTNRSVFWRPRGVRREWRSTKRRVKIMATTSETSVSFDERDSRDDEMHSTIEQWINELVDHVDDAQQSEEFREWLDVQSRFHEYSHQNTLLIKLQCPEATKVAGYHTWRNEFDRHVQKGEQAIWIWAPIITKRCPECKNAPSYHDKIDCEYDETPPDEWSKGLVGFRPTTVFDVSQTEGEPLPELDTAATGEAGDLVSRLTEVAGELGVTTSIVDPDEWQYGDAMGVCKHRCIHSFHPIVEVKARSNQADLAVTMIHEYAHALLHFDVDDDSERAKREVEAEAVAYIVGRFFDLDTSGSVFYLAVWENEDSEVIQDRLSRISSTAQEIIGVLKDQTMVNEMWFHRGCAIKNTATDSLYFERLRSDHAWERGACQPRLIQSVRAGEPLDDLDPSIVFDPDELLSNAEIHGDD